MIPVAWLAFFAFKCYNSAVELNFISLLSSKAETMTKDIDIINAAVSLVIKAAILAAGFSGRVWKRSLKRLAAMDVDSKDKEIIFLRDKVNKLQMQVSILQKGLQKKQNNKRHTLREKLFIICYMETFQIPRRSALVKREWDHRWISSICLRYKQLWFPWGANIISS